jgi:tRNA threonylcarbamoyladenosine biosynthesis protein TsaE
MPPHVFLSQSEADTDRLGAALAAALPRGTVVAINGTLGAGKTRLVQAFAAALGVPREDVTSPTFVLVHRYDGLAPIYHLDAYRVRDDDEFLELGVDEFFGGDAYALVEWAERVPRCLPAERVEVRCEVAGETVRRYATSATTPALTALLPKIEGS